jgi:hypothetical protein
LRDSAPPWYASHMDRKADAGYEWKVWILEAIREVALRHPTFTADDVEDWRLKHGGPSVHERRALGAQMKKAAKAGYCATTNESLASRQRVNNSRPMQVWRSLLYRRDES